MRRGSATVSALRRPLQARLAGVQGEAAGPNSYREAVVPLSPLLPAITTVIIINNIIPTIIITIIVRTGPTQATTKRGYFTCLARATGRPEKGLNLAPKAVARQ